MASSLQLLVPTSASAARLGDDADLLLFRNLFGACEIGDRVGISVNCHPPEPRDVWFVRLVGLSIKPQNLSSIALSTAPSSTGAESFALD